MASMMRTLRRKIAREKLKTEYPLRGYHTSGKNKKDKLKPSRVDRRASYMGFISKLIDKRTKNAQRQGDR